jgi:glycosyltransferase involved in cell wall biosynthesis
VSQGQNERLSASASPARARSSLRVGRSTAKTRADELETAPASKAPPPEPRSVRPALATESPTAEKETAPAQDRQVRPARICVVVPAFNEARSIARVVERLRRSLPDALVVVVNDGSEDDTARRALRAGATVISLPVNLGIGGAVQVGYRYALRHGFDVAIQVDGDDQHDPSEIERLLAPIREGRAEMTVGSRWLGRGDYVATTGRRFAMRFLARLVSWRTGATFTDTTSGFRAVGVEGIALFARTYPTDFPEVESLVLASRNGLRLVEVPVRMSPRGHGQSSIAGFRSAYYMARVTVALLVGSLNEERPTEKEAT